MWAWMPSKYAASSKCSRIRRANAARFDVAKYIRNPPCCISLKRIAYPRVGLASEKAAFTVVLTKGQYCLSNPVVPIWLQQELHHVMVAVPKIAAWDT